jgi:hypothetical protein
MNKMKISYNTIVLFLSIVLFYSCDKELDYKDLDFKPQIVLNGLIYQDSIVGINVARTKSILELDSVLPFLENAGVKLYENNVFVEDLIYDSLGMYHSTTRTKANTSYRIEATANGMETATAWFSFNSLSGYKLENIDYQVHDTVLSIDKPVKTDIALFFAVLKFDMLFNDKADEENYYDFGCNGSFYSYINEMNYTDSGFTETKKLYKDNSSYLRFSNYHDGEKFYPNGGGSSYNGYELNSYITDKLFNGEDINFGLNTSFFTDDSDPSIEIALFSYPYDYIYFQKTGYRYVSTNGDPFSQPVNIYSNVENGLGIVCGITSCKQKIYLSH